MAKKNKLKSYTADEIKAALDENDGNITQTAKSLRVSRSLLSRHLASLNIDSNDSKLSTVIKQEAAESENSNSSLSRKLAEDALAELIANQNLKATIFYLSSKCGYASLKPVQKPYTADEQKTVSKVLTQLKDKEITAVEAGLELSIAGIAMPEILTILISKTELAPAENNDNSYSVFTDADFTRRMEERSKEIQEQLNGLPARRQEIDSLRASTADSFTQQAQNEDS